MNPACSNNECSNEARWKLKVGRLTLYACEAHRDEVLEIVRDYPGEIPSGWPVPMWDLWKDQDQ